MAIVCRKYRLLFIIIPRTACTAIGQLLREHYDGEFIPSEDIVDTNNGRISIQKKHSTLTQLIKNNILTDAEAKSLLKVAAVRNPFDTLVSLYLKQRFKYQPLLSDPNSWASRDSTYAKNMRYARTHSFTRWVLRKCSRQMVKRFLGFPNSMFDEYTHGADVVMQYERIEQDLEEVFKRAGMPAKANIPVVNRTAEREARNYRAYYSQAAAAAVRLAFYEDLKAYGYSF